MKYTLYKEVKKDGEPNALRIDKCGDDMLREPASDALNKIKKELSGQFSYYSIYEDGTESGRMEIRVFPG